jgi:hypothetical protein
MHRNFFFSNIRFLFLLETDIIMSCTFDLSDEKCPIKDQNDWQIQTGTQSNQIRPVSDHTRGGNRNKKIFSYNHN